MKLDLLSLFFTSTFFSGFLPGKVLKKAGVGGGLMGSLVAFGAQLWFLETTKSAWADVSLILVSFILGLLFIKRAEEYLLRRSGPQVRHTGHKVTHDFNQTNIDEVHGQAIAALPIFLWPLPDIRTQVILLVFSLILFRIFDTRKPRLVRFIEEKVGNSLGIILDDTFVGVMVAAVLCLAILCYAVFI